MKKYGIMAGLVLVGSILFAQGKSDTKDRATREADKMKTELSLTDAQYNSIKSIHEQYAGKWAALKSDSALSKEAKHEKMKTLFNEKDAAVKKVLTKEQSEKLKANRVAHRDKQRGNHHGKRSHEAHALRMQKELSLNEEQTTKIKAIDQEFAGKFRALKSDSTLAKADSHERAKALHQEYRTKTKAVLTPEQFKKWESRQADRMKGKKGKKG